MYTGLSHRRYTPKVEYELKVIKGYSRLSIFANNEVIVISWVQNFSGFRSSPWKLRNIMPSKFSI